MGPVLTAPSSLRIGLLGFGSLDPKELDSPESLQIAAQVFDGLVGYDPASSAVVPALAERWEVLDGGRRFAFSLREGAIFHDGTPVTAQHFVDAWTRLADPGRPSPFAFLLEPVEGYRAFHDTLRAIELAGVSAPDERTFEVRLTEPRPDFVALLGHPALSPVPPGADEPTFALLPVGTGPFRVSSQVQPGTPIVLERFEGYYGAQAGVPNVVFTVHNAPEDAWPEFLSGDLDVAPIPAAALADAESQFGTVGTGSNGRLLSCGFNQDRARLRNRELRRAVSLAVDRRAVATGVYADLALPATGIVPPGISGHREQACGDDCDRDVSTAASIVDGLPENARSFALDYADSPVGRELAEALAGQLEEAGLDVTPRPHDEDAFTDLLREGDHEMFCLVWVADYPRQEAYLEPLFHSSSVDNRAGLEDERLDSLLETARSEEDPSAREEAYRAAEARALELMPVVPLVWFRSQLAAKPYVEGFRVDPLGNFDAAALSIQG